MHSIEIARLKVALQLVGSQTTMGNVQTRKKACQGRTGQADGEAAMPRPCCPNKPWSQPRPFLEADIEMHISLGLVQLSDSGILTHKAECMKKWAQMILPSQQPAMYPATVRKLCKRVASIAVP